MSEASDIDIKGDISERLNAATPGKITVLSYVDPHGRPHTSVRASIHAHSGDQLALWARYGYVGTMTSKSAPPEGGFLRAITHNPHVSVLYREGLTTYVFSGRARVETDPAVQDAVFDALSPGERGHDFNAAGERTGQAVIIDLDHVVGGTLAGGGVVLEHVEMARDD